MFRLAIAVPEHITAVYVISPRPETVFGNQPYGRRFAAPFGPMNRISSAAASSVSASTALTGGVDFEKPDIFNIFAPPSKYYYRVSNSHYSFTSARFHLQ
jgi:hypothetical protein